MELTNHIKERYAERMAGRDTTIDINTYIAQNAEKIEKDISKLLEHSEIIYTGICSNGKEPVNVRLSGTWVIITDVSDRTAITLYKIELGLDEEFNKAYVERYLTRLNSDKKELEEAKTKVKEEVDAYKEGIKANEGLIEEYENLVRRLKNDNKYYEEIVKGKSAEYAGLEIRVRRDIDALTRRINF